MTSAIIESGDKASKVVVDGSDQNSVSMQQFQFFYSLITGKNEEIARSTNRPVKVSLDDLQQLDSMVDQMLEQYNVVASTPSYYIYFESGEKGLYSSYEQFARSVGASSSSTESIFFKYQVAVILPKTTSPQTYTISVRCANRLVLRRKMRKELPIGVPAHLLNMFALKTVEIKIEYVDFALSRAVMAGLEGWMAGLAESKENKFLKVVRDNSGLIPVSFRYLGLAFVSWGVFEIVPRVLNTTSDLAIFAKFSLVAGLLIFLVWKAFGFVGRLVENFVDSTTEISHTNITRGDGNDVIEASEENGGYVKKAVLSGTASGVASFFCKYLASLALLLT